MTASNRKLWHNNKRGMKAVPNRALLEQNLPNPFMPPVKKAKPAAKKARPKTARK